MRTIGFLINPFAGLGGRVGLKGSDGLTETAIKKGAVPESSNKALIALRLLKKNTGIRFLTCSGDMGENAMISAGIELYSVVYRYDGVSTARDTNRACREFVAAGAELIVFTGGDGTARDVYDAAGPEFPILGIPAGVKMFSGVFAITPQAAAEIINTTPLKFREAEIADIDEEAYRRGEFHTRVHGIGKVPFIPELTQGAKQVFETGDEERAKKEIAQFLIEVMADGMLTILGPGTTTAAVAELLGIKKTLLGFDAVQGGTLTGRDLDEKGILSMLEEDVSARVIVSPIGAQGFVIGRGTQVISPEVIRRVGIKNFIVAATPGKLANTPVLYIDTGDPALDAQFGESIAVISGYRMAQRKKLYHSSTDNRERGNFIQGQ
jgi:predicted polyphosphate/ATP-dependent NAD kinase